MRIAFVINALGNGGAERSVIGLAQGLRQRGHEVDIVLFRTNTGDRIPRDGRVFIVGSRPTDLTGEQFQQFQQGFSSLIQLPCAPRDWFRVASAFKWDPRCLPSTSLVRQARAVAGYMAREEPDCVLPSLGRAKVATLLSCRFFMRHPPVIPVIHSNYERRSTKDRCRLQYLAEEATHFVGVSQGTSALFSGVIRVPRKNITTIYNPVVTPELEARMTQLPNHPWLLDGGTPVVLAAGRLAKAKDFATLIKAFARLVWRRPCRLVILGEGKERKRLQRLVERLKLKAWVSLPGWVENPFAYMSRASLFVVSSTYEGLSLVLVEALACGCPCVSTDCPSGPAEILQNGEIGPLVPVGDEVALAAAMERVLDRPPNRRVLQRRAADFSANRAVTAYEKLLMDLVGASHRLAGNRRRHPFAAQGDRP